MGRTMALLVGMVALASLGCDEAYLEYQDTDSDGAADPVGGSADDDGDDDGSASSRNGAIGEAVFLDADVDEVQQGVWARLADFVPEDAPEINIPGVGPVDPETYFGFHPLSLNVIVLGDLGTAADPYSSDFQGAAAVGGDVYTSSFSLNDLDLAPDGISLYAGGLVDFTGAVEHGGIDAAGDILLDAASVAGDVAGGGDLDGSGLVTGDATVAGQFLAGLALTVQGAVTESAPYAPALDLPVLAVYMQTFSSVVESKAPTTTATEQWGEIIVEASSGMNVVEIAAGDLDAAWGVRIDGPSDARVYINVPDATATLDSLVWTYTGGVTAHETLLNYGDATQLTLMGGNHEVNILAPHAATEFPIGLISGNLVVASLVGGGQVNDGGFCCNPWDDKYLP
jgi:choice-of-anchor A domain-containing protein